MIRPCRDFVFWQHFPGLLLCQSGSKTGQDLRLLNHHLHWFSLYETWIKMVIFGMSHIFLIHISNLWQKTVNTSTTIRELGSSQVLCWTEAAFTGHCRLKVSSEARVPTVTLSFRVSNLFSTKKSRVQLYFPKRSTVHLQHPTARNTAWLDPEDVMKIQLYSSGSRTQQDFCCQGWEE